MINGLDLFSGYGGITVALQNWVKPVAYCEIEKYAQSVLLSRISDGQLPRAPIWDDITSLNGTMLPSIDIIYGGFPCQDISIAGNGVGLAGKRSGLFFELCRLVKEIEPRFVFLENVPAIRTRGLREVIREFTNLGYDCRWTCVSASEVGAQHIRKRWFLLAYASSKRGRDEPRRRSGKGREDKAEFINDGQKKSMADTHSKRLEKLSKQSARKKQPPIIGTCSWESEPDVGRVVNGCPARVDRIKALGNGVVPAQAEKAFKKLMSI